MNMKFDRKVISLIALCLALFSLIDRLYWVNGGYGLEGWINAAHVPIEYEQCKGRAVEYKQIVEEDGVRYRCSLIGGDIPVWPFYTSGTVKSK